MTWYKVNKRYSVLFKEGSVIKEHKRWSPEVRGEPRTSIYILF